MIQLLVLGRRAACRSAAIWRRAFQSMSLVVVGLSAERPGRGGQHFRVDEMAAPLARDEETLVHQLLEGEHHRAARHAEFFREDAAGRKRHGSRDLAIENGGDDRLADLRLKRLAGLRRDAEKAGPYGRVVSLGHGVLLDVIVSPIFWPSDLYSVVQTAAPIELF